MSVRALPAVILEQALQAVAAGAKVLAISGAQGSGKTTLARQLVSALAQQQISATMVSLDDYYLSRQQRLVLSAQVHPLLKTRGVPGTHQLQRLHNDLTAQWAGETLWLPSFDKAADDCGPNQPAWRGDVLIIEGWCLGLLPLNEPQLSVSPNQLESVHDSALHWRHFVNQQLALYSRQIWPLLGPVVLLQAPDWAAVCRWRAVAEQQQRQQGGGMTAAQLEIFMQHYQRWTTQLLAGQHWPMTLICYLDDTQQFYHFTAQS